MPGRRKTTARNASRLSSAAPGSMTSVLVPASTLTIWWQYLVSDAPPVLITRLRYRDARRVGRLARGRLPGCLVHWLGVGDDEAREC